MSFSPASRAVDRPRRPRRDAAAQASCTQSAERRRGQLRRRRAQHVGGRANHGPRREEDGQHRLEHLAGALRDPAGSGREAVHQEVRRRTPPGADRGRQAARQLCRPPPPGASASRTTTSSGAPPSRTEPPRRKTVEQHLRCYVYHVLGPRALSSIRSSRSKPGPRPRRAKQFELACLHRLQAHSGRVAFRHVRIKRL